VDRAYCWGNNFYGQLGDGTTTKRRLRPFAVSGQRRFDNVNAGYFHTCGVTLGGRGFCWGLNSSGDLGNGTPTGNLTTPTAVLGGLTWRALSGGISHTCGVTTDDRAYCWGQNMVGQLGDGTTVNRLAPVAVAGPMSANTP
jgi:alpha-tubulin suppressor-like RCC1 family protein